MWSNERAPTQWASLSFLSPDENACLPAHSVSTFHTYNMLNKASALNGNVYFGVIKVGDIVEVIIGFVAFNLFICGVAVFILICRHCASHVVGYF